MNPLTKMDPQREATACGFFDVSIQESEIITASRYSNPEIVQ